MNSICVFCGSSKGANEAYARAARQLGEELVRRGLTLVYGGGNIGLMGLLADAVLNQGGRVVGVIPQALMDKEVGHTGLTELHVVGSMHERKAMMAERADGFIALPGGFGTFEEFLEVITWTQLGLHQKPCGLLNICGFYDPLIQFFDHAMQEQFIRGQHRKLMMVETNPAVLLEQMTAFEPPTEHKWIDKDTL